MAPAPTTRILMAILYCFWVLRLGSEAGCFAAVRDGTSGRLDHLPDILGGGGIL